MPATSSDRYSAVSSSSVSSTSSANGCNNPNSYSSSQSSSRFSPLRSATSSLHLSKPVNTDYRSMQSLKFQQQQQYQTNKITRAPIARISPLVSNQQLTSLHHHSSTDFHAKDESWLSCEELETIEKRFTDLLQETSKKKALDFRQHEQRAKSCDRLAIDERNHKPTTLTISRKSVFDQRNDDHRHSRVQTPRPSTVLSANDILKVESAYRSIGTQVYACRCLCDLYITTAERLAKLEDWILFQHGSPVWLLNSGTDRKRQPCLSLIIAEYGSGFPVWQETINGLSDIKQAREQHITFRLSDKVTLAVLRFNDFTASKEFFSYYISIRNDPQYKHLFSNTHHRSSSCGSILTGKRKSSQRHVNKSSISNPCQFQHITRLQVKDRARLTSLNQCLMPAHTYVDQLL